MDDEVIILDQAYKYEVKEILDGGIGYVRLMALEEFSRRPPESWGIDGCLGTKYPYRTQLVAKTIKYREGMGRFSKACDSWLGLNMQGVVPLLKTVKIGDEVLALMPRYTGNLRTLIQSNKYSSLDLLKALHPVILSLSKVWMERGSFHLAIKPENILYCLHNQKLVLELSDWGIADVQAGLLPGEKSERIKALDDFGMLPYIAPERFDNYLSDICADVFSLGMVFFEIMAGCLPYGDRKSVAEQIVSGEYYKYAESRLAEISGKKSMQLILRMLNPVADKRLQNYGDVLALIA